MPIYRLLLEELWYVSPELQEYTPRAALDG